MIARTLLAITLALVLAGCGIDEGGGTPSETPDRPDRIVTDFRLTETREGHVDWQLNADEAEYFKEAGQTRLRRVEVEFFREDGSRDSRLTSDRGLVIDGTGDMTAEGNVHVVSADGDSLRTEELRYIKAQNLITGPGFVRLARPDRVLTGIGFKARPDLTEYEIDREVKVTIVDREGSIRDER